MLILKIKNQIKTPYGLASQEEMRDASFKPKAK